MKHILGDGEWEPDIASIRPVVPEDYTTIICDTQEEYETTITIGHRINFPDDRVCVVEGVFETPGPPTMIRVRDEDTGDVELVYVRMDDEHNQAD